MKASVTVGGKSNTMGDIDESASLEQVPNVVKPPASKDILAGKDIDEGHGGINQTVRAVDGAASSTTRSTHDSSCPTAAEMGIN